jgi:hypothetical protein
MTVKKFIQVTAWLILATVFAYVISRNALPILRADAGFTIATETHLGGRVQTFTQAIVGSITTNSPAEKAGLKVGDRLEDADAVAVLEDKLPLHEKLIFNVTRGSESLPINFQPEIVRRDVTEIIYRLRRIVLTIAALGISLLLILSRAKVPSLVALFPGLIAYGAVMFPDSQDIGSDIYKTSRNMIFGLAVFVMVSSFLSFWHHYAASNGHVWSRFWRRYISFMQKIMWLMVILTIGTIALLNIQFHYHVLGSLAESLSRFRNIIEFWNTSFCLLGVFSAIPLSIFVLARLRAARRNAAYWLAGAVFGLLVGYVVQAFEPFGPVAYASLTVEVLSFATLFYVALSTDLLSLSFVINRAVLYTLTGVLLLVGFFSFRTAIIASLGLDSRAQSEMTNGLIAVLTFIAKQTKGIAEKALNSFVFAEFADRQKRLVEFIDSMDHYSRPESLKRDLVAEVSQFFRGAAVELYEASELDYRSEGEAHRIDLDDPNALKMRKTGRSFFLEGDSDFSIFAPAMSGRDLLFFVAVRRDENLPKARPDELALLQATLKEAAFKLTRLEVSQLKRRDYK